MKISSNYPLIPKCSSWIFCKVTVIIFLLFLVIFDKSAKAQLFQEQFSSPLSSFNNSAQPTGSYYVNTTAPSNLQFTHLQSGAISSSIDVNTSVVNALTITETSTNSLSGLCRNVNLSATSPNTLFAQFDLSVTYGSSGSNPKISFALGGSFTNNLTKEAVTNVFAGLEVKFKSNSNLAISSYGSATELTTFAYASQKTLLIAANKSGAAISYLAPDGTCETLANNCFDIWVGAIKAGNDVAAVTSTASLNQFKLLHGFTSASSVGRSNAIYKNLLIDPIPATPVSSASSLLSSTGIGFIANWTPVSGVTGYEIDVATDAAFTAGLTTIFVAGANTSSAAVTGLIPSTTYYYRVRSVSQYSVATYKSCSSATQTANAGSCISFSTQPTSNSYCTGNNITLNSAISGSGTITFQWFTNNTLSTTGGSLIGGANNASYNVPSSTAGTYYYYCTASNGTCTITSNLSTIVVTPNPTFTSVSQATPVCAGNNATINLTGLVASAAQMIYYHIGAGGVQSVNITSTAGGLGTFSLVTNVGMGGQLLIIDSIKTACKLSLISGNTVSLTVNPTPANPTGAVNGFRCSAGTVTVSVAAPAAGYTINWYDASTGGNLLATASNSYTTPTMSMGTVNTYYAETVAVPSNGCVSLIRQPVTATVSQAGITLTSSSIFRPVPVSPFITNLPYSSVLGSSDRYDLTWGGSYGFVNVTNAILPVGNIPLTITNALPGVYTGTIVVRSSTTGCVSGPVPFSLTIVEQLQGDYGTIASGNWADTVIWRRYDTASGTFSISHAGLIPILSDNVWVNSGHTVNIQSTDRNCKNLYVKGNLISSNLTKAPVQVLVYGSLVQMFTGGYIGSITNPTGDNADGISITSMSSNLKITGSAGSVFLSRLCTSKDNGVLVIDRDVTLTYHGTSNQGGHTVACFPASQSTPSTGYKGLNTTMVINENKTLTFMPWASLSTTANTGTLHPTLSFTVNVYGTIQMLNSPAPNVIIPTSPAWTNGLSNATNNSVNFRNSFIYGGTKDPGNVFSLNIFNGGLVNTPEIYPNGADAASSQPAYWMYDCGLPIGNLSNINVAAGGKLNVYKMADFRVPGQTVTGAGTFTLASTAKLRMGSADGIAATGATGHIQTSIRNFSTTGVYAYEGTVPQITGTGMPSTVSGVIINNANNVSLTANTVATDSVNMSTGKLILGDKNMATNTVRFANNTSYFVTNGAGALKLFNVSGAEKFFPVGPSITSYNPAWITNSGASDNVSVKVEPYALSSAVAWPAGVPRIFRSIRTGMWNDPATWETQSYRVGKSVNRSWTIGEDVSGGSNLSVRFQWTAADELPGFNRSLSSVVRFNGSVIDYPVAPIPYNAATGTDPYLQTGNSIASTVLQFGVVSDTSTSLLFGSTTNAYPNSSISHVVINPANVVTTNTAVNTTCGDLQIDGTLNLSGSTGDNLLMAGNWNRSSTGVFNPNGNAIIMNGGNNTSITAVNGERFSKLYLQKNATSNSVTLLDSIAISKELTLTTGTLNLGAKNVTLLSDSTNTASFGTLTSSGAISYSGTGRFVVERYIHTGTNGTRHAKSWQLLSAPTIGQTIKQSWMENGMANSNPVPGYGTQIVGVGGTANGFDMAAIAPSMKVYSPLDSTYVGVANTGLPINNTQGYMLFVRGDRSVTAFNTAANPTILRTKGTLQTGNVAGPAIPANKFQSVANPYPSAINYAAVTQSGLTPFLYVFDPILSSYYGLGAFQTIELANGNATPGGTSMYSTSGDYRTIQSGQAFFVRAGNTAGAISFKETDKVSGSRLAMRSGTTLVNNNLSSVQTRLYLVADGHPYLVDGNKVVYGKSYADKLDEYDARKMMNAGDNLGLMRQGEVLSIEARSGLKAADTVNYFFRPYKKGNYYLQFNAPELKEQSLTGLLIDHHAHTSTLVKWQDSTLYAFSVDETPSSSASDRFVLIIKSNPKNAAPNGNEAPQLHISPNPITGHTLQFSIDTRLGKNGFYEISNMAGQVVQKGTLNLQLSDLKHLLPLHDALPAGAYQLKVFDLLGHLVSASFLVQ